MPRSSQSHYCRTARAIGVGLLLLLLTPAPDLCGEGAAMTTAAMPLVTLPRMDAPSIDGKLGTVEWSGATALSDFVLLDGSRPAREQTVCLVGYDRTHLFFGLRMSAYALDPASNQAHAFKADITEDVGTIWQDDSVEVRFSVPSHPNRIHYIVVNANAAKHPLLLDYKADGTFVGAPPWQADLRVRAGRHEGYWTVELAVPFTGLCGGVAPVGEGLLSVDRFERRLGETSAWTNLRGNLMNLSQYGRVVFGAGAPAVRVAPVPELNPGANEAAIELLSRAKCTVTVQSVVLAAAGESEERERAVSLEANVPVALKQRFTVPTPGRDWVRFIVNDADGRPFYRGRMLRGAAKSANNSVPVLTYEGDVPGAAGATLFVNGEAHALTSELKVHLAPTANLLALHIPKGVRRDGRLKVRDQFFPFDESWLAANTEHAGWETLEFDDGSWRPFSPATAGAGGDELYLRRLLLVSASRTYPRFPDDTLFMTVGGAYGFQITYQECTGPLPPGELADYRLVVDLPTGLELVSACSSVGRLSRVSPSRWKERDRYAWRRVGEVRHSDGVCTRYRIERDGPVRLGATTTYDGRYDMCVLAVRAGEEASAWPSGASKAIRFHCEADGGRVQEVDNMLPVTMLPGLDGEQPKTIRFSVGGTRRLFRFHADEKVTLSMARTLAAAGVNELMYSGHADVEGSTGIATYEFLRCTSSLDGKLENFVYTGDMLAKCRRHLVRQGGTHFRRAPCWDEIMDNVEAQEEYKKAIRAYCERFPHQRIIFDDFEYPAYTTNEKRYVSVCSCFCPYSLERFRKTAGIAAPLTEELIGAAHLEKWIDYWTSVIAFRMGLQAEAARSCGREFVTYSAYHSRHAIDHYTFDYTKIGPHVDRAMAGYGRPLEAIAATRKALAGRPLVGGLLSIPAAPAIHSAAVILRRVLDCGGGVLLWWEDMYDGRKLTQVAAASRFVARNEKFFTNGEATTDIVASPLADALVVRRLGDRALVILLNESPIPLKVPLEIKGKVAAIRDAESSRELPVHREWRESVPGNGFRGLLLDLR